MFVLRKAEVIADRNAFVHDSGVSAGINAVVSSG